MRNKLHLPCYGLQALTEQNSAYLPETVLEKDVSSISYMLGK